ncbi:MAG: L-threonylcarbamoyladenylate synthase [Planctomycetota bacterium]
MAMVEVITIYEKGNYGDAVARAAAVADQGGVVAFPTETVYGVGARADRPEAMDRLRTLKERTNGRPFTVHIAERDRVHEYVPAPPALGLRLVRKGWPGPLTLLFRVSDPSTAPIARGRETNLAGEIYHEHEVGLRCPDHEVARGFLAGVAGPVVAASANRAGCAPACTAFGVLTELGDEIDLLLDAGPAEFGRPSTIVRVGESGYELVREGVYDARTLRRLASLNLLFVCTGNTCRSPMAAGLFKPMLARRLGCSVSELADHYVAIRSAGTSAGEGSRAAPEAAEVMRRRDIDITDHLSVRLSPELINQADRIYVMTQSHAEAVTAMVPSAHGKTRLLSDEGDIEDPIGGGVSVYESCARQIEQALPVRAEEAEL